MRRHRRRVVGVEVVVKPVVVPVPLERVVVPIEVQHVTVAVRTAKNCIECLLCHHPLNTLGVVSYSASHSVDDFPKSLWELTYWVNALAPYTKYLHFL